MSGVELLGYSERGVLGSLLYEIKYHRHSNCLLNKLIGTATFPFTGEKPLSADTATILVEHSLSDFGDPDVVILIDSGSEKCAVFIEAKVDTWKKETKTEKEWLLAEFKLFKNGVNKYVEKGVAGCFEDEEKKKVPFSNLFSQLYHKQRFVENSMSQLKAGVTIQEWSTKTNRKIGGHPIVEKVAVMVKEYCANAFYLMLIPDNETRVADFFRDTLQDQYLQDKVDGWDTSRFGYLTWQQVECFCKAKENNLENTLAVFHHNRGQIYKKSSNGTE